jgi:hypothetical protein
MWGSGFVANWGSTAAERQGTFDCDVLVECPDQVLYRAVTVDAPASVTYRWVCQLTQAPYSYDLIDNGGRCSPRELTAGADELTVGQCVMRYFELTSFAPGEHLTVWLPRHRLFGDVAVTYLTVPTGQGACRLVAKIAVRHPPGIASRLAARLLPAGDLVMMRRQLLNLKARAEATSPTVRRHQRS